MRLWVILILKLKCRSMLHCRNAGVIQMVGSVDLHESRESMNVLEDVNHTVTCHFGDFLHLLSFYTQHTRRSSQAAYV